MITLPNYQEDRFSNSKSVSLLILIAYLFSFALRLIWVYQMGGHPEALWNNEIMINTNDGYYFATAARSILEGTNSHNPQLAGAFQTYPVMVYLTAYAAKLLPFSLETVILYMPAVISSLIVIPVILIGRLLKLPLLGFFAALIASIGWSYYNRTMVGYYDSDMFSVVMQMFVLYSILSLAVKHRSFDAFLALIFISTYPYFYPQGLSLIYGMYLIYIVYVMLFLRKNEAVYFGIASIAVALMPLAIWIKIPLFLFVWWLFHATFMTMKHRVIIGFLFFAFFLLEANVFTLIFGKISDYLNRGTEEGGLHFFQVIQTVREAGKIPFSTMANRISGSSIGVILSLIGYIILVLRKREMIIALPLIGVGLFSLWGGLRFTVYAVPVAAISAVFLFYIIAGYLQNIKVRYALIVLFTSAMLYPNIMHIINYRVPTVFNKYEVASLDKLSKEGTDRDYVITWWDYGYPIWFYANKNTLIDGSKHHHDNFIVSEILTADSQLEAARLSRIAVETYVKSGYKTVADTLFKVHTNPSEFLRKLRTEKTVDLPEKTREIYLYLPYRMLNIFSTVAIFSNLDLLTGEKYPSPFYFVSRNFKDTPDTLYLGGGLQLDKKKGLLQIGKQQFPLKQFVTTSLGSDGNHVTNIQTIEPNSPLSLVYMQSYKIFLVLDEKMYNSNYIQMFVLGHYDKSLYELVESTPYAKIFKIRI